MRPPGLAPPFRRRTLTDRIFTACCIACRAHAAATDRRSLDAIGWCLLLAAESARDCPSFCPRCLAGGSFLVVVCRDVPDRVPLLVTACNKKPVTVTLDRRVGERRAAATPPGRERRTRDRRSTSIGEWPASGWLAFQQRPCLRGPLGC